MNKILAIKLVLSLLFIGCLFDMPYGYFQVVRTVGMVGFIWLYNIELGNDNKYIWIASAILINPIFKIPLGREIWNIIDIIWVTIFVYTEIKAKYK